METPLTLVDWIPIAISLISLFVSGLALGLQRRATKEIASVSISRGFLATTSREPKDCLFVDAINNGERVITISSYGLIIPSGDLFTVPLSPYNPSLPVELGPGKKAQFVILLSSLNPKLLELGYAGSIKLKPRIRTQSDKFFSGRSISHQLSGAQT